MNSRQIRDTTTHRLRIDWPLGGCLDWDVAQREPFVGGRLEQQISVSITMEAEDFTIRIYSAPTVRGVHPKQGLGWQGDTTRLTSCLRKRCEMVYFVPQNGRDAKPGTHNMVEGDYLEIS